MRLSCVYRVYVVRLVRKQVGTITLAAALRLGQESSSPRISEEPRPLLTPHTSAMIFTMFKSIGVRWMALVAAILLANSSSYAETITVSPSADTTLFETSPDNNMGAEVTLAAGSTARSLKSRALIRFDLAGSLPAGAQITGVSLRIQAERAPLAAVPSSFTLRRVLVAWTEGTKRGSLGAAATPGEPTWKARSAPGTLWAEPGGAMGTDFAATASASVQVSGVGTYDFESTPELVADAQLWLDQPDANFGWVLASESEQTAQTARRFGSRENAANAPVLTVEYSGGGGESIQITSIVAQPPDVVITWSGGSPPFELQQSTNLSEVAWATAAGSLQTNTVAVPMSAPQAFFRVTEAE